MPITIPNYNTSPPSDDGSQTEANKVKFSTIKEKLSDPLEDFIGNWHEDAGGSITTTGTGGAFLLTTTVGYTDLADVPMLVAKANHAAVSSNTINVDSLGAKTLNNAGAVAADTIFVFTYDPVSDEYTVLSPVSTIPSTTKMLFVQSAAPTGWTKITDHNDKALRVVSGDVVNGGSVAFSTVFGKTATDSHTLTSSQSGMPNHRHTGQIMSSAGSAYGGGGSVGPVTSYTGYSGAQNASSGHSHNMDIRVQYVDVIVASKD